MSSYYLIIHRIIVLSDVTGPPAAALAHFFKGASNRISNRISVSCHTPHSLVLILILRLTAFARPHKACCKYATLRLAVISTIPLDTYKHI